MNSTLGSVVPLAMFSLIDHQSSLLLFNFKLFHWISIVFLVSLFVFLFNLYGEALRATDDLLRGKERIFGGGAGGIAGLPKYFCLTQLFSLSLSKTMFYHFCICHISETLTSQLFGHWTKEQWEVFRFARISWNTIVSSWFVGYQSICKKIMGHLFIGIYAILNNQRTHTILNFLKSNYPGYLIRPDQTPPPSAPLKKRSTLLFITTQNGSIQAISQNTKDAFLPPKFGSSKKAVNITMANERQIMRNHINSGLKNNQSKDYNPW